MCYDSCNERNKESIVIKNNRERWRGGDFFMTGLYEEKISIFITEGQNPKEKCVQNEEGKRLLYSQN